MVSICSSCAPHRSVTSTQGTCCRYPPTPYGVPFVNSLALLPVCDWDYLCGEWTKQRP